MLLNLHVQVDDAELPYKLGSPEELELFDAFVAKGRGNAAFDRAGPFWQMACLRCRKYDLQRAYDLVLAYMKWREEFRVNTTTVNNDPEYRALVERGVIEACGNQDKAGRYVLTVRQRRTDPGRWSPRYAVLATHAAIESLLLRFPEAQVRGVAFVNDMSGIRMVNMDSRVPREMFAAFSSKLPVRFGGLYAVNPPLWLRAVQPLIRVFMSKKMQSRMRLLAKGYSQLPEFFELDQIPTDFEGSMAYNHREYLRFVENMQGAYGIKRTLNGDLLTADQLQQPSIDRSASASRSTLYEIEFSMEPGNLCYV